MKGSMFLVDFSYSVYHLLVESIGETFAGCAATGFATALVLTLAWILFMASEEHARYHEKPNETKGFFKYIKKHIPPVEK